jgi:hypothetical protein
MYAGSSAGAAWQMPCTIAHVDMGNPDFVHRMGRSEQVLSRRREPSRRSLRARSAQPQVPHNRESGVSDEHFTGRREQLLSRLCVTADRRAAPTAFGGARRRSY